VDRVEKMAMELDSATPQIEITAKLVDVDSQTSRDLGNHLGRDRAAAGNDPANNLDLKVTEGKSPQSGTVTYGLTKSWGLVSAKLDMLERMNKVHIISNPRITTVDNREAKIWWARRSRSSCRTSRATRCRSSRPSAFSSRSRPT